MTVDKLMKLLAAAFTAGVLLTCFAWFVPAQVTQIGGLAVAQSGTQWNRLKDASQGDTLTNGIGVFSPYLFNGTNFDRQRGTIAGGAEVNLKSFGGGVTPTDGFANPTDALKTFGLGGVFNNTTWDRTSGISAAKLTATTSTGTALNVPLSTWSVTSTPAVATQATASRAAGGAGVRHVATTLTVCIATGATAQTPILAHLRDGATGAGTILRSFSFAAPVNGHGCESISGLAMIGTAATAMTIEFAAAGVAASQETVTLTGFSVP